MASSEFQKKSSSFFVTALIGLIVVSFMFTGYSSFKSSGSGIGQVGDYKIKVTEYQNELNRTIKYYSQMMGGRNLTAKDIERFALKRQVLMKLKNMKLRLVLADYLHIDPSTNKVADQIQKLPYFLDKGVFSLSQYKTLLQRNGLTPQAFEETIIEDLKVQTLQDIFSKVPLSKSMVSDLKKFKAYKLNSYITQFNQTDIQNSLSIPPSAVRLFLAKKENDSKVEKLFNERKSSLSTKEEVEAAHILLKTTTENEKEVEKKIKKLRKKLTTRNFAKMAEKYTEDPSGKSNGGDLGRFGKGRMVKSFEQAAFTTKAGRISQPIKTNYGYHIIYVKKHHPAKIAKLVNFKSMLAKELIRKTMGSQAKKKLESLTRKLQKLFKNNNTKGAEKLAKKNGLKFEKNLEFNQLDGYQGKIKLNKEIVAEIFKTDLKKKSVFSTNLQGSVTIAKIQPNTKDKLADDAEKKILAGQEFLLTKTLMTDMLGTLEKKVKVNIRKDVIN